jgi:hypothetical protein
MNLREIQSKSVVSIQVDVVLGLCEYGTDISGFVRTGYLFITWWFINPINMSLLNEISLCESWYQVCSI